jgi:hypothetical protein
VFHTEVNLRPIAELTTEIVTLAGHINAAQYRFLELLAEFDRRQGWSDGATQSCAHWLNWKCGIGVGAAREKVRVARALENLPGVAYSYLRQWGTSLPSFCSGSGKRRASILAP